MVNQISPEIIRKINELEMQGETKRYISRRLGISYEVLKKKYTKKTKTWKRVISDELKKEIRQRVQAGVPKIVVARELNISYDNVRNHTRDILSNNYKKTSDEMIRKIRENIMVGKTRFEVSKEFEIPYSTVQKYAKDLPVHNNGWPGVRGRSLKILQDLLKYGYVFLPPQTQFGGYHTLKKYFPTVRRRYIQHEHIVFLEDKGIEAMWAVIDLLYPNRMISDKKYREFVEIFIPGRNQREKRKNLGKKPS